MSMSPLSGSAQTLQTLKAQQAWEARKANRLNGPSQTTPTTAASSVSISQPVGNTALATRLTASESTPESEQTLSPAMIRMGRVIPEVQEIARRAGFVGVTEQDIQRAYVRGESLLTDYRV